MNKEEIERTFPIGSRIVNDTHYADDPGTVESHVQYVHSGSDRHLTYYLTWRNSAGAHSSWPEFCRVIKTLSPLELSIQAYIDEERRQLVG